jgi:1-acyl-sn-glycerol-3-phosphate acyltransferase
MRKIAATTRFFNNLGRRAAYFYVRRLMRSEIEWYSDVPRGAKVIAANHPTTTDPFLMMSWPFEPIHILITEDAFKVPVLGQFLRLAGHIPVYRDRGHEAFDAALQLLNDGHTVGIYPEGALSEENGQLVSAHTGAVRLAATAGVPLVPVGVALDRHFVKTRQLNQFGVQETMRWYWLGAYEVSMGRPLIFDHPADDRQAVKQSTDVLMEEIRRQVECSAQRLLDACWSPGTSQRSLST